MPNHFSSHENELILCCTKINLNYSDLTKNTFQAIEIDETQYFDRDICPGKSNKLNFS